MSHPSDNLYSADDASDGDSFSEELSPADGFNRSERVPNAMVVDPSIDSKPEAKTLIPPPTARSSAGQNSRASIHALHPQSPLSQSYASRHASRNAPPSPPSHAPVQHISTRQDEEMDSESSALINGPPPAYTPSPISPTASQSTPLIPTTSPEASSSSTYNTFPEEHLERGYLPRRDPESMGSPVDVPPSERTPLSATPSKPSKRREIIKKILVAAIILAVITAIMTSTFRHGSSDRNSPNLPGKDPSNGGGDDSDDNRPIDSAEPYCAAATYKEDEVLYEFPIGQDLSVLQTTYGGDYEEGGVSHIQTVGEIRLRRLPKNSHHGSIAYFTVNIHTSDPALEVKKTWDSDSRLLKVNTPRSAQLNSRGPHCVSVSITAWFPEDAVFDELLIEAISLKLRVIDDVKIKVTGRSRFHTISGGISFPNTKDLRGKSESYSADWRASGPNYPFDSRSILVETVSGTISGTYPLMDYLALASQSGSIGVDVVPQPVLLEAPKPADLEVQTASGTIKVDCPVGNDVPPPRNYITRVHSMGGSISGSYYLGSESNFKSSSGSIRITGLPVLQTGSDSLSISSNPPNSPNSPNSPNGPNNSKSRIQNVFETHSISGTTAVEVLDPIFIKLLSLPQDPDHTAHHPSSPASSDSPLILFPPRLATQSLFAIDPISKNDIKLRNLRSIHDSSSGGILVTYPAAWEGTVHAKAISGSISATGPNMRVIKHRKGPAYHELLGRRGVDGDGEGCFVDMADISGNLHFVLQEY